MDVLSAFAYKITDADILLKRRARNHLQRARDGVRQLDGSIRKFTSCVDRFDNDEQYRRRLVKDENLTREDIMLYDELAALPKDIVTMPFQVRSERMKHHAWDVVQEKGGGSSTVSTTTYPTYHSTLAAKAAAPLPTWMSSSSSSWNKSGKWWTQSWSSWEDPTPPWKKEDKWWDKDW